MSRHSLRQLLSDYGSRYPLESPCVGSFQRLLEEHPDCLFRTCLPGHITASCWILSPDLRRALLHHHRKLDRWLQLGGHVDGNPDILAAAVREAQEESAIAHFQLVPALSAADPLTPWILDLDIHEIPAHASERAHLHYDVRFLLISAQTAATASTESLALQWVPRDAISSYSGEESVLRLERRAHEALPRPLECGTGPCA